MTDQPNPNIPAQPDPFRHPLPNLATALDGGGPVRIVAIGSSTTAGEGGIVAYPYRLEAALRNRYKDRMIDVLNRGKSGDEAPKEFLRLKPDVVAESPSLVIWQVGTNAVWKGDDLKDTVRAISAGLDLLAGTGIDIVLMDPQFVPAIISDDKLKAAKRMVSLIADAADMALAPVNVFRRFELMKKWHDFEKVSFDRMIDPTDDARLHHSDWSTQRMAQALCDTIVRSVPTPS